MTCGKEFRCSEEVGLGTSQRLHHQAMLAPVQDTPKTSPVSWSFQTAPKPVHLSVLATGVVHHAGSVEALAVIDNGLGTTMDCEKFDQND